MKSGFTIIGLALISLSLIFSGCNELVTPKKGSEASVEEKHDFRNFKAIKLTHGFEVEIVQSNQFSITTNVSDNIAQYLKVKTKGDTLVIGLSDRHVYLDCILKAKIQLPLLTTLISKEGGEVIIKSYKGDNMDVFLSGGSELTSNINLTNNFNINASGGSELRLTGKVQNSYMQISGESELIGKQFTINNNIHLFGSGESEIELIAKNQIRVELSGASIFDYSGSGHIAHQLLSGDSEVNKH
ncbi:MAG: DUF2807 domain-containing protein [Flavobacteriales bacterium]|nr:DUF2807 domain-containing protein [Flavobacteriales bacterium]